MATQHPKPSNRDEIRRCNIAVTERFKLSLKVYKSLKMLVLLAAVGTAIVAINNGADPLTVYTLVAVIIAGPEAIETAIANGGDKS